MQKRKKIHLKRITSDVCINLFLNDVGNSPLIMKNTAFCIPFAFNYIKYVSLIIYILCLTALKH